MLAGTERSESLSQSAYDNSYFYNNLCVDFHGAQAVPVATYYLVCWPIRGIVVDKRYMIGHYLAGLHSKFIYYCELVDQK